MNINNYLGNTSNVVNKILNKSKLQSKKRSLKQDNKNSKGEDYYNTVRNRMKYFAKNNVGIDVIGSSAFKNYAVIFVVKDIYNYSEDPYNYLTTNKDQLEMLKSNFENRFGPVMIVEGRYVDDRRDPRGYFPLVGYGIHVDRNTLDERFKDRLKIISGGKWIK